MKKTYRVPRTPRIPASASLPILTNSDEILTVMGFSETEMPVARDAREEETQSFESGKSPFTASDDDDQLFQTANLCHTRREHLARSVEPPTASS
jgi:hypothetical protein